MNAPPSSDPGARRRPRSVRVALLVLALLGLTGTRASAAPPPNDDFDNATVVTSIPFSHAANTSQATLASDDPACGRSPSTVWYSFTPGSDIQVAINTFESTYGNDVGVFTGTRGALTQVECGDWGGRFLAMAGVTYYIQVGAWEPPQTLVFTVLARAPNDAIENATVAEGRPFMDAVDVTDAEPWDDQNCAGGSNGVWYVYTPESDTVVRANTFGSQYDTTLSAYTGSPGSLTQVACNDNAGGTNQSRVSVPATGGTDYWFMVGNKASYGDTVPLTFAFETPEAPVLATPLFEMQAAAGIGWLAWTQNSARRPAHMDVFVRPDGEAKFKVNPRRTEAFNGGIDGTTLVYQQVRRGQSNVRMFDLSTRTHMATPTGVNTPAWEYWPRNSGDHLLVARLFPATEKRQLLLFDIAAGGPPRVLDSTKGFIGPGQVNGNYAVWHRCTSSGCDIFLYDIAARRKSLLPDGREYQYSPGVTTDGTVYAGRGGARCGQRIKLVRIPLSAPAGAIVSLPPGTDIFDMQTFTDSAGATHVLYSRFTCRTEASDVYEILDGGGATLAGRVAEGGRPLFESLPGRLTRRGGPGSGPSRS